MTTLQRSDEVASASTNQREISIFSSSLSSQLQLGFQKNSPAASSLPAASMATAPTMAPAPLAKASVASALGPLATKSLAGLGVGHGVRSGDGQRVPEDASRLKTSFVAGASELRSGIKSSYSVKKNFEGNGATQLLPGTLVSVPKTFLNSNVENRADAPTSSTPLSSNVKNHPIDGIPLTIFTPSSLLMQTESLTKSLEESLKQSAQQTAETTSSPKNNKFSCDNNDLQGLQSHLTFNSSSNLDKFSPAASVITTHSLSSLTNNPANSGHVGSLQNETALLSQSGLSSLPFSKNSKGHQLIATPGPGGQFHLFAIAPAHQMRPSSVVKTKSNGSQMQNSSSDNQYKNRIQVVQNQQIRTSQSNDSFQLVTISESGNGSDDCSEEMDDVDGLTSEEDTLQEIDQADVAAILQDVTPSNFASINADVIQNMDLNASQNEGLGTDSQTRHVINNINSLNKTQISQSTHTLGNVKHVIDNLQMNVSNNMTEIVEKLVNSISQGGCENVFSSLSTSNLLSKMSTTVQTSLDKSCSRVGQQNHSDSAFSSTSVTTDKVLSENVLPHSSGKLSIDFSTILNKNFENSKATDVLNSSSSLGILSGVNQMYLINSATLSNDAKIAYNGHSINETKKGYESSKTVGQTYSKRHKSVAKSPVQLSDKLEETNDSIIHQSNSLSINKNIEKFNLFNDKNVSPKLSPEIHVNMVPKPHCENSIFDQASNVSPDSGILSSSVSPQVDSPNSNHSPQQLDSNQLEQDSLQTSRLNLNELNSSNEPKNNKILLESNSVWMNNNLETSLSKTPVSSSASAGSNVASTTSTSTPLSVLTVVLPPELERVLQGGSGQTGLILPAIGSNLGKDKKKIQQIQIIRNFDPNQHLKTKLGQSVAQNYAKKKKRDAKVLSPNKKALNISRSSSIRPIILPVVSGSISGLNVKSAISNNNPIISLPTSKSENTNLSTSSPNSLITAVKPFNAIPISKTSDSPAKPVSRVTPIIPAMTATKDNSVTLTQSTTQTSNSGTNVSTLKNSSPIIRYYDLDYESRKRKRGRPTGSSKRHKITVPDNTADQDNSITRPYSVMVGKVAPFEPNPMFEKIVDPSSLTTLIDNTHYNVLNSNESDSFSQRIENKTFKSQEDSNKNIQDNFSKLKHFDGEKFLNKNSLLDPAYLKKKKKKSKKKKHKNRHSQEHCHSGNLPPVLEKQEIVSQLKDTLNSNQENNRKKSPPILNKGNSFSEPDNIKSFILPTQKNELQSEHCIPPTNNSFTFDEPCIEERSPPQLSEYDSHQTPSESESHELPNMKDVEDVGDNSLNKYDFAPDRDAVENVTNNQNLSVGKTIDSIDFDEPINSFSTSSDALRYTNNGNDEMIMKSNVKLSENNETIETERQVEVEQGSISKSRTTLTDELNEKEKLAKKKSKRQRIHVMMRSNKRRKRKKLPNQGEIDSKEQGKVFVSGKADDDDSTLKESKKKESLEQTSNIDVSDCQKVKKNKREQGSDKDIQIDPERYDDTVNISEQSLFDGDLWLEKGLIPSTANDHAAMYRKHKEKYLIMWKSRRKRIKKFKTKDIILDDNNAEDFDNLAIKIAKCHIANPATYPKKGKNALPTIFKMHWLILAKLKAKKLKLKKAKKIMKQKQLKERTSQSNYRRCPLDCSQTNKTHNENENLFQYALQNPGQQLGFSSFLPMKEKSISSGEKDYDKSKSKCDSLSSENGRIFQETKKINCKISLNSENRILPESNSDTELSQSKAEKNVAKDLKLIKNVNKTETNHKNFTDTNFIKKIRPHKSKPISSFDRPKRSSFSNFDYDSDAGSSKSFSINDLPDRINCRVQLRPLTPKDILERSCSPVSFSRSNSPFQRDRTPSISSSRNKDNNSSSRRKKLHDGQLHTKTKDFNDPQPSSSFSQNIDNHNDLTEEPSRNDVPRKKKKKKRKPYY